MLMLVGWAFCPFLHATEWGPDTRLTYSGAFSSTWSYGWSVAISESIVHVVWQEDGIHYKRSIDGGLSWEDDDTLTINPADRQVCIAANSSYVHVVWYRGGSLMYRRSTTCGSSWDDEVELANSLTGYKMQPCINTDKINHVHIAFILEAGLVYDGYYLRSVDAGITWDSPIWLSGPSGGNNGSTVLVNVAADTLGQVHFVYDSLYFFPSPWHYLKYRRSTDNGVTWQAPVQLALEFGTGINATVGSPKITTDQGDNVHFIWFRYAGMSGNPSRNIRYKRSTNGGTSWESSVSLSSVSDNTTQCSITADHEHCVYIVYSDAETSIYFRSSTNDGASWQPLELITTSTADLDFPHIASYDTNSTILNVVWEDSRDGNNEIYYKRGRIIIGADESERQTLSDSKLTVMPNPFFHRTNIRYQMTDNRLQIKIYDASGRVVKIFNDNLCNLDNFVQSVCWDGRDDSGQLVPQGIYFVTLKTDKFVEIKKIVLMR